MSRTISVEENKVIVMKEMFEEVATGGCRGIAPKRVVVIKVSHKVKKGL